MLSEGFLHLRKKQTFNDVKTQFVKGPLKDCCKKLKDLNNFKINKIKKVFLIRNLNTVT